MPAVFIYLESNLGRAFVKTIFVEGKLGASRLTSQQGGAPSAGRNAVALLTS